MLGGGHLTIFCGGVWEAWVRIMGPTRTPPPPLGAQEQTILRRRLPAGLTVRGTNHHGTASSLARCINVLNELCALMHMEASAVH